MPGEGLGEIGLDLLVCPPEAGNAHGKSFTPVGLWLVGVQKDLDSPFDGVGFFVHRVQVQEDKSVEAVLGFPEE